VAFNRRFIPSIVRLKEWTTRNTVRFARAEMLRTNRLERNFAIETGIHVFDAIRFLMGHPEYVEVKPRTHDNTTACDYSVRLDFSNSAVAEISLMLHTGVRRESYYLGAASGRQAPRRKPASGLRTIPSCVSRATVNGRASRLRKLMDLSTTRLWTTES
jgi:predicted dehydrogenase